MSRTRNNLKDKEFGSWLVLDIAHYKPGERIKWVCKCKCGTIKEVDGSNLVSGASTKCKKCAVEKTRRVRKVHHPLYWLWQKIKKDSTCYWWSFDRFLNDILPRTGKFFRKIDKSCPFGPTNFIWSDKAPKRRGITTILGVTKSQAEWGTVLGLSKQRIQQLTKKGLEKEIIERCERMGVNPKDVVNGKVVIDDQFKKAVKSLGRSVKYPWKLWLNCEEHTIFYGKDYKVKYTAMLVNLRTKAKTRNLKVTITKIDGGLTFRFMLKELT